MGDGPNYYILLELDPSVRDAASIEDAIKKKQAQWSGERNHPTKGVLAKQYLEEVAKMRKLLQDEPQKWNEHADDAKKELEAKEKEKYDKIRRVASITVKNGEISQENLNKLVKDFKLTDTEILKIINAKVKKEEVLSYKDDGIEPLENAEKNKIQGDLNIVGEDDLFKFLGCAQTYSCAELLNKADKAYNDASRHTTKSAKITAQVNLASLCKKWFKDDNVKRRYEKTLRLAALDEVYPLIDQAANDGIIESHEYEKLIEACARKGIRVDEAEYRIDEYCKKIKPKPPIVQKPAEAEYKKQVQCGFCGHLNDKTGSKCGKCGNPLIVNCPKCGKEAASVDRACSGCGFSIGDMPNAELLIRDAKVEIKKKNLARARNLLAEAEVFNPAHPDIEKLKAEFEKENESVKKISGLFAAKKYIAAQAEIANLKGIHPANSDIPKYEKRAGDQVSAAADFCKKAAAESNSSKKLSLYLAALDECEDYSAARTGVSSVPVDAPTNLTVAMDKKAFVLNWRVPAESRSVKYKVIRKENAAPVNMGDGVVLAETEGASFRDEAVEYERKYYYGVCSVRGDRISAVASSSTPAVLALDLEEVKNLKGKMTGGSLYLDWVFPDKCDAVKIEYSSNKDNRGVVTEVFTKAQYDDSLSRGFVIKRPSNEDYYFTVYCRYTSGGKEYYSKGVKCLVVNSEKINIYYRVVVKGLPLLPKSACLKLECKHPFGDLPEIMVIAKRGGFPIRRQDGKCIMNIKGADMSKSVLEVGIPLQDVKDHQVRLFFVEDNPKMELIKKER